MFLIVILRLFLVLKWIFQVIGIIAPIFIFWEPQSKGLIAVISAIFIIFPELVMATILWVSKGALLVYKIKTSDPACNNIPIFDDRSIQISILEYILILISISFLIGSFLEIHILFAGISAFTCFAYRKSIIQLIKNYLEVSV